MTFFIRLRNSHISRFDTLSIPHSDVALVQPLASIPAYASPF